MTREEAKGNLRYAIRWNDMPKKEALDMAIEALEQEETGHWMEEKNEHYGICILTCSECGHEYQHFHKSRFCPNCGVKMIEPKESEDKDGLDI